MMQFFLTPKDMLAHVDKFGTGLCGTLGWSEMESAMLSVIRAMATDKNDWLYPIDLNNVLDSKGRSVLLLCADIGGGYMPDLGRRWFWEYFTHESGNFFIGAEALIKLHRGIGLRP